MINNKSDQQSIQLIHYRELDGWNSAAYFKKRVQSTFPIVKLGLYVQEENHKQNLQRFPNEDFGILGINNKTGIFDAYKKKGEEIQQPYKRMEIGWLAYNPYRVNVGSIGMRTSEQQHNLISPAYIVFRCQPALMPEFLCLLFRTLPLTQLINDNITGSVRQSFPFENLKQLYIPLPPTEIQEKLLKTYKGKINFAAKEEKEAFEQEQQANVYLLEELGIDLQEPLENKDLQRIPFRLLDRWNAGHLLNPRILKTLSGSKYPVQTLKHFLASLRYGSSFKATTEPIGIPILRMNNIKDGELDISELKYIPESLANEQGVLLDKEDLLFNRTNSKELVGKTAVFNLEGAYTFASYLIRLKLDTEMVNVYFINYLFNSPIIRMQIDQVSRLSIAQANVNTRELEELWFPIPDKKNQDKIAERIGSLKKTSRSLKEKAEATRKEALNEFERIMFKLQP